MVIAKRRHGDLAPHFIVFVPVTHHSRDAIVTVCKNVRLDFHGFSHGSLDRKPPAFHFRTNASDDDALRRLIAHIKSLTRRRRAEIPSESEGHATSPLLQRRGGCASSKCCQATF